MWKCFSFSGLQPFGRNKVGRSFSFGFAAMGPFFGQKWQWYCSFNYKIVVPLRYVMPKIEHFLHFYQHSQSSLKKIVLYAEIFADLCAYIKKNVHNLFIFSLEWIKFFLTNNNKAGHQLIIIMLPWEPKIVGEQYSKIWHLWGWC